MNPLLLYIGPGQGLGLLGTLVAVVIGLVVAFLGLILYPLVFIRKRLKNKKAQEQQAATDPASTKQ